MILEASRQMAAEASYCMATGLHALPIDDSKGPMSPSGNLTVNMCHTVSFSAMMLLVNIPKHNIYWIMAARRLD